MIIEPQQLLVFIAAGWLLNLTPGPDVLYIVSNALRSGARAGLVAGLGITAGCFVHVFAAAVGVGALLSASATAFTVLKWAGAAYLLLIGVRMLFSRAGGGNGAAIAAAQSAPPVAASLRSVFLGGFWTNVLNPKVALFFLAFVPQFIAPGTDNKALAFVLLGVLFNVNAIPVNAGWALAAAWLGGRTQALARVTRWMDGVAGAVFIAFCVKLALTEAPAA